MTNIVQFQLNKVPRDIKFIEGRMVLSGVGGRRSYWNMGGEGEVPASYVKMHPDREWPSVKGTVCRWQPSKEEAGE